MKTHRDLSSPAIRLLVRATVVGLLALTCLPGCKRARRSAAPQASAAPGWQGVAAPQGATPTTAAVDPTAQRSEFVAQGKPDPACRDCRQADAQGGPNYHGTPHMKLDETTLDDVRSTVDQTCSLLEQGVDILEANVSRPEKAAGALKTFQKKKRQEIERIFHRADEVRGRLSAAGYDQDIPAEIQPMFEARMGAIQRRLEKMREVYREHPDVLEAFGGLFPRTGK